jgi:hypothetical protein
MRVPFTNPFLRITVAQLPYFTKELKSESSNQSRPFLTVYEQTEVTFCYISVQPELDEQVLRYITQ